MATGKKSFVLYTDLHETVKQLPDNKAGILFKTILAYVNDENPDVKDLLIKIAFEPIKLQLKRDLKKWEGEQEQRKAAGIESAKRRKEAAEKKERDSTSVDDRSTEANETGEASTVNGTVTVTVNENVKKGRGVFTPPSLIDVISYFIENGYSKQSAEKAFNYYNTADWKDSKGNKVRNWKQKMQGVWFKDENRLKDVPVLSINGLPEVKPIAK